MMSEFPLHQWFDITKRISRQDRVEAEIQMEFYAIKDQATNKELKECLNDLRKACRQHNKVFDCEN